ncbi:hypothetical protein L207DRAFT_399121, partial [Hyaloscypha variabilis F]
RRRIACQQCRRKKVKCDNVRPICGFCAAASQRCVYMESHGGNAKIEPTTRELLDRLDQIQERVDSIASRIGTQGMWFPQNVAADGLSKDYLRIPSSNTTADTVLTWPIFQSRFPPEHLTNTLLTNTTRERDENSENNEAFFVHLSFEPLSDERIPYLLNRFLENVHTKNPILDVEALIRWGKRAAAQGPGWDATSCLVLLACALGAISLPFQSSVADRVGSSSYTSSTTSSTVFSREIRQAESCYSLACRRLGLLRHTVLGAQCYFYSAVYLMYTFHPIEAWNHFCQASTFYQIHFHKTTKSLHLSVDPAIGSTRVVTQRRLEQSLYWSCFKSECEMRVELHLPQSAIANIDYPHMFPSPPSHPADESGSEQVEGDTLRFEEGLRDYTNKVLVEEKSWYYYLTEVALRRIGNRILNTFYRKDHTSWANIIPLIPIAKEFQAQILVWSANLPPSMQYDDNALEHLTPSQELSWATCNRLLEMRFWLFQPFLYHVIHCDPLHAESQHSADIQSLVEAAMECNVETVRNRTLRHRHHGIWFDIRAVITASFTVIAAAKSGRVEVAPEWEDRIKLVIATLAFWEGESPDVRKSREVLEELFAE